jgi:tRNA(Ile)-lysidine synthase TilS/MesJ
MKNAPEPNQPAVSVVTSHGRQALSARSDQRLVDVLAQNHVPWSAVSIYAVPKDGGEPKLCSGLDMKLSQFPEASELLLYFNRNVNPFMFSLSRFRTLASEQAGTHGSEYFYQELDNAQSRAEVFLKKLSPEECREVVARNVTETICSKVAAGSKIVVGVSGGGDSNALLHGLTRAREKGIDVHPVIIKGIPDWDAGVPRAQELCKTYGFDLTVIEEPEVKGLLGMTASGSLIDRFEREFVGDDFEFLGTLLIRLALSKRAELVGTPYICTGLNLEDAVCENLFRVASGLKPASYPTRAIGERTLLFPLWLCPKRIIDGCFPKYSRENYDARYPCFSLGRNLYYSLIYSIQSQFPGFVEQLAHGFSELAQKDPVVYKLDEQLGFYVERFTPFPLLQKFRKMLGESAVAGSPA